MAQELSYFRLSLLSYLRDSHPLLVSDTAFIASRGERLETYRPKGRQGALRLACGGEKR